MFSGVFAVFLQFRKFLALLIPAIIGVHYLTSDNSIESFFVTSFTEGQENYNLYLDKHSNGNIYVSLWDGDGQYVLAVTKWFQPKQDLSIACSDLDSCFIVTRHDDSSDRIAGLKLTRTAVKAALTQRELDIDINHGFEPFTRTATAREMAAISRNREVIHEWLN